VNIDVTNHTYWTEWNLLRGLWANFIAKEMQILPINICTLLISGSVLNPEISSTWHFPSKIFKFDMRTKDGKSRGTLRNWCWSVRTLQFQPVWLTTYNYCFFYRGAYTWKHFNQMLSNWELSPVFQPCSSLLAYKEHVCHNTQFSEVFSISN